MEYLQDKNVFDKAFEILNEYDGSTKSAQDAIHLINDMKELFEKAEQQ